MSSPTPPASFEPLDSRNGVPGDTGELTALARRYADTAAEIDAQAARLRLLTSQARGGWKGEAGENFGTIAGDLAERIGRAKRRYEAAARALTQFADGLDDVQTAAYGAVRRAQDAEDAQRALRSSGPAQPGPGATPEQLAVAVEEQRLHDRAVAAAMDDLSTARRDYDDAVGDYHRVAGDAARTLRHGRGDDGLADSWWDRHAGWISDVLDVIGAILLVLTIVVLIIGVVSTGGALLAALPLLGLLGAGLSAISFGGHLALWMTDNGSGADVLWDLAGLVTLGLGTLIARGVRSLVGVTARGVGQAAATGAVRAQPPAALPQIRQAVPDAVAALHGVARTARSAGGAVTEAGLDVQSGVDTYGDFVVEPTEEARDEAARAEIVAQWSMPLMHVR